mmetsp:Transcript_15006/g.31869  ORF Transcript_15006/g.31869 Transcript_15006/m.31869 type:complete len:791 (+) Transcript_15006:377-2749(+)
MASSSNNNHDDFAAYIDAALGDLDEDDFVLMEEGGLGDDGEHLFDDGLLTSPIGSAGTADLQLTFDSPDSCDVAIQEEVQGHKQEEEEEEEEQHQQHQQEEEEGNDDYDDEEDDSNDEDWLPTHGVGSHHSRQDKQDHSPSPHYPHDQRNFPTDTVEFVPSAQQQEPNITYQHQGQHPSHSVIDIDLCMSCSIPVTSSSAPSSANQHVSESKSAIVLHPLYNEALQKLAESMKRTEVTRRHVMMLKRSEATRRHVAMHRSMLGPEQQRALCLAKERLNQQNQQGQQEQLRATAMTSFFDDLTGGSSARVFRETGEAHDRVGVRGVKHANQGRRMGPANDADWFNDHMSRSPNLVGSWRRGPPMIPGLIEGGGNVNQTGDSGRSIQEENIAFLAPRATLIGTVRPAPHASILYKSIPKSDVATYRNAKEEERRNSLPVRMYGRKIDPTAGGATRGGIHFGEGANIRLPVGRYERKKDTGMLGTGSGIGHPTVGGAKGGGIYVGWGTDIRLPVGRYKRKKDAGTFNTGSVIGHPTVEGANGGEIYFEEGTGIQDACMVTSYGGRTTIENYVSVGHDESLIGVGAELKPDSVVESQSLVGTGAIVDRRRVVKEGDVWGDDSTRKSRHLTAEEKGKLQRQDENYIEVVQSHDHVMKLGESVPDSFTEHDLLGAGINLTSKISRKALPVDGVKLDGDTLVAPSNATSRRPQKREGGGNKEEELKLDMTTRKLRHAGKYNEMSSSHHQAMDVGGIVSDSFIEHSILTSNPNRKVLPVDGVKLDGDTLVAPSKAQSQ